MDLSFLQSTSSLAPSSLWRTTVLNSVNQSHAVNRSFPTMLATYLQPEASSAELLSSTQDGEPTYFLIPFSNSDMSSYAPKII